MADDFWHDDKLGRKTDADFLIQFLSKRSKEQSSNGQEGAFVLNLDAPWGHGKTFFLTRMKEQLKSQNHLVAYINAWQDDHANDPLLSVISEIDKIIQPHLKKNKKWREAWSVVKKSGLEIVVSAAKHSVIKLVQRGIGEGVEEIKEVYDTALATDESSTEITPPASDKTASPSTASDSNKFTEAAIKPLDRKLESLLESFRKQQNSEKTFRQGLQTFLELADKKKPLELPLFILIDELDRCRPTHAIEMLERIKHLFDIPNIVFVLATDTSQLRHVVRGVYGDGFDSTRYLLRFFDRTYMFTDPDVQTFVHFLFETNAIETHRLWAPRDIDSIDYFAKMMLYFELTLRDIEQCFDMFHDFYTAYAFSNKIHLAYLLPLICTHNQGRHEELEFLSHPERGHSSQEKKDLFSHLGNERIQIEFIRYDANNYQRKEIKEIKPIRATIDAYWYFLSHNMSELSETISQSKPGELSCSIAEILRKEIGAITYHQEKNNLTITHHSARFYPELVKSSGRLAFQLNKNKEQSQTNGI
ncbi:MAG: KAP family NTPase [Hyphomicrobiaceae bacterium]|nr:KAP family NTPase [Hyphomicrobiaceae bacterium]